MFLVLEINPKHPIIIGLSEIVTAAAAAATSTEEAPVTEEGVVKGGEDRKGAVAKLVAQQVFDNALIAAGLVDDPRAMLSRLNNILEAALVTK